MHHQDGCQYFSKSSSTICRKWVAGGSGKYGGGGRAYILCLFVKSIVFSCIKNKINFNKNNNEFVLKGLKGKDNDTII